VSDFKSSVCWWPTTWSTLSVYYLISRRRLLIQFQHQVLTQIADIVVPFIAEMFNCSLRPLHSYVQRGIYYTGSEKARTWCDQCDLKSAWWLAFRLIWCVDSSRFRSVAQLIYCLRTRDHNITDAVISLHWLWVPKRIQYKLAVLAYRVYMATHHVTLVRWSASTICQDDDRSTIPTPTASWYHQSNCQQSAAEAIPVIIGLIANDISKHQLYWYVINLEQKHEKC